VTGLYYLVSLYSSRSKDIYISRYAQGYYHRHN